MSELLHSEKEKRKYYAKQIVKKGTLCYTKIVNKLTVNKFTERIMEMTKQDKKNAFLYCKFRDEQFALYDAYAKKNGMLMKTLLVLNVLYYAKTGMTQRDICEKTFQSKQTVNLIIKNLLKDGYITVCEDPDNGRNKLVAMTKAGRDYAKKPVVHITLAEDTAMSMLTPQEQEQLISLSRKFTKNLADLIHRNEDEV